MVLENQSCMCAMTSTEDNPFPVKLMNWKCATMHNIYAIIENWHESKSGFNV